MLGRRTLVTVVLVTIAFPLLLPAGFGWGRGEIPYAGRRGSAPALGALAGLLEGPSPRPGPRRPASATPRLKETALPTPVRVARARAFARRRAGIVSLAVVDTAGRVHCHECRRRYVAASVVKVMLFVAYLDLVAAERRPLDGV